MSILDKTTNLELTQYGGSPVKAQFYANYNSDMQKIDLSVSQLSASLIGVGTRVTTLEGDIQTISNKADNAVSTANEAKATADGMDTRVTAVEGDVSDLKSWKDNTIDPTLEAYDGRLDAIEAVIETVSTANIDDLIARMDALEQKVDANTQGIDTLNDNLISAVNRITDLETGLGTTNANLNALASRVTLLEDCCSSVRETLTDHNTRINKNASDISALDARLTRDETNIAGNASDITILATQNNTQSQQIDDLYSKYNALDPTSPTNLYSRVQTLEDTVGDTPLQTTAQTVTGAINELLGEVTGVDADEVAYDNAHTGMVASNVQEAIDILSDSEDALAGVVGDSDGGLVKDVADLQTTVGDNSAGLVKDVADLGTSVGTLETTVGDATAGLVKDVADLQTTVGDATAGLVKDVDDLQTTVGDATAGLVKDVADVQEVIPSGASASNKLATENDLIHVYSTTEQIVGTWIDNKPIYEVSIEIPLTTLQAGVNFTYPYPITNLKHVLGLTGIINRGNYPTSGYATGINEYEQSAQWINVFYDYANKEIAIHSGSSTSSYSNGKLFLTIKYQKTTD